MTVEHPRRELERIAKSDTDVGTIARILLDITDLDDETETTTDPTAAETVAYTNPDETVPRDGEPRTPGGGRGPIQGEGWR